MRPSRIVFATDRPLQIAGFRELLRYAHLETELLIISPDALQAALGPHETCLVMLDGESVLPWGTIGQARLDRPDARFVVWCSRIAPELVRASLQAGMHGMLSAELPLAEAAESLRQIWQGECRLRFNIPWTPQMSPQVELTERERLVLSMIADGMKNREIAATLHRSESGVKISINRLFRKTGARSRSELALLARGRSQASPDETGLRFEWPGRNQPAPSQQAGNATFDTLWMFDGGEAVDH